MVERNLAKVEVASSTLVSRSIFFDRPAPRGWTFFARNANVFSRGRGTQVVRERSAKPLCVGSIPTRASTPPVLRWRMEAIALDCPFAERGPGAHLRTLRPGRSCDILRSATNF